jgi:primary-amine oxidase
VVGGNYENNEFESNLRLSRALTWVRNEAGDNGYAHPVEGLFALVDLNTMTIVDIEDNGVTPVPRSRQLRARIHFRVASGFKDAGNCAARRPSFEVDGYHVNGRSGIFVLALRRAKVWFCTTCATPKKSSAVV